MMKKSIFLFLVIILISVNQQVIAQEAKLDTANILIGNPVKLQVIMPINGEKEITFQEFDKQIIDGIEIIEVPVTDSIENGKFLRHTWLITSFDDSTFTIPPLFVYADGDTLSTNALTLHVKYFRPDSAFISKIDTTQLLKIRDIKGIENTPLTFAEFWNRFGLYIILSIIGVLLAIGLYIFLKKRKENKPIFVAPKPKIPPHQKAFAQLEALKEKKLWQQEKVKLYYTELTDILRVYIETRFQVPAMELTSEQLNSVFKHNKLTDNQTSTKLAQILNFADLAKFAKLMPLPNENDLSMTYAFDFIEKTKLVEENFDSKEGQSIPNNPEVTN